MKVLVTGFEPFDGQAVNASWLAVEALAHAWTGGDLETLRLPVSFRRAPQVLMSALDRSCPSVVDGAQPVDQTLAQGEPLALHTGLPVRACLEAVTRAGVPVEVSNSAGTFVCNAVFYALVHRLAGSGVPHGFVHVPRTPAQVPGVGGGMPTVLAAAGLAAIVEACANA